RRGGAAGPCALSPTGAHTVAQFSTLPRKLPVQSEQAHQADGGGEVAAQAAEKAEARRARHVQGQGRPELPPEADRHAGAEIEAAVGPAHGQIEVGPGGHPAAPEGVSQAQPPSGLETLPEAEFGRRRQREARISEAQGAAHLPQPLPTTALEHAGLDVAGAHRAHAAEEIDVASRRQDRCRRKERGGGKPPGGEPARPPTGPPQAGAATPSGITRWGRSVCLPRPPWLDDHARRRPNQRPSINSAREVGAAPPALQPPAESAAWPTAPLKPGRSCTCASCQVASPTLPEPSRTLTVTPPAAWTALRSMGRGGPKSLNAPSPTR